MEQDDDLPPPAYVPQRPAAAAPRPAPQIEEDAAAFVAPRPRPMGQPSAEALARLQAAVHKSPAGGTARPAAAAPAPRQAPAAEKPRFGIGSLINRMAGHSEPAAERPAPARQQPPVTAYDDEPELSADQERIEIPAFLRRQAN